MLEKERSGEGLQDRPEMLPVFPIDRLQWKNEDFDRARSEMKNIPCIKKEGVSGAIDTARSIRQAYEREHGGEANPWKEEVAFFDPTHIMLRYGGEDWTYGFHEQKAYGKEATDEVESSVTGIAKNIMGQTKELAEQYREAIKETPPEHRNELKRYYRARLDDFFATMFQREEYGNVRVREWMGPRGPVYMTVDGNHRLAAARMLGFRRVRGSVERIPDPEEAKKEWYAMLGMLKESEREEVRRVYDALHPPKTNEERKRDAEKVAEAIAEGFEVEQWHAEYEKKQRAKEREEAERYEQEKEVRDKVYREAEKFYEAHKENPEFKQLVWQVGLEYLWNHKERREKVQREYEHEVDQYGWMKAKSGFHAGHVLGIDIDGRGKQTDAEIKVLAMREWQKKNAEGKK